MANNLILLERFNTDLSAWTLDTTGGAVSIVTQDYSPKLKLDDTSGSAIVSALRTFTEPSGKWILEYDINHAASSVGILELLDSSNNPIVTVDLGSTATTLSFSTDIAGTSTATVNAGIYKQIILVVDNAADTVKCYIIDDTLGSLNQVGASKAYSGAGIAKFRFKTGVASQGIIYIDEVKIYTPDMFVIGDSITDGAAYWSTNPALAIRSSVNEDETSPPHWHLAGYLGSTSTIWVANRAFSGSDSADIDSKIASVVIDHGAQRVYIGIGHNDIVPGIALSAMQTNMNSIITKLQNAGITGANIILGNVFPGTDIDTAVERSKKQAWNTWLQYRAIDIGAVYVDLDTPLKDPADENAIKPGYHPDGIHLNSAGSQVLAKAISEAMRAKAYNGVNIVRGANPASDERLYKQGSAPASVGRTATVRVDFTQGVSITRTTVLDFLNGVFESRTVNLEWLGRIGKDSSLNIEFLKTIQRDGSLPVEWVKAIAQNRRLNAEFLKTIQKDGAIPMEWLGRIAVGRTAQLPVEWLGRIAVGRTAQIPVEWVKLIAQSRGLNVEVNGDTLRQVYAILSSFRPDMELLRKHIFNGLRFTSNRDGTEKIELLDDDNTTVLRTWVWNPSTKTRSKAT